MDPSKQAGSREGGNHREEPSLLIVEDDRLIRESLLDWLRALLPGWNLTATRSRALMGRAPTASPDAIIVDLALSNGLGLDAVRKLVRFFPDSHVVALTMDGDYETREAVLTAGASDYLPIWKLAEQLESTLHRLTRGEPVAGRRGKG